MDDPKTALPLFKAFDYLERQRSLSQYSERTKLALVHTVEQDCYFKNKCFEWLDQFDSKKEVGDFCRNISSLSAPGVDRRNPADEFFAGARSYIQARREIKKSLITLMYNGVDVSLDENTDYLDPIYEINGIIMEAPWTIIAKVKEGIEAKKRGEEKKGIELPAKLPQLLGERFVKLAPEYEIAGEIEMGEMEEEIELLETLGMMTRNCEGKPCIVNLSSHLKSRKIGIFNNDLDYKIFVEALYYMGRDKS